MLDRAEQNAGVESPGPASARPPALFRASPDWRRTLQLDGAGFLAGAGGPWVEWCVPAMDRPAVAAGLEREIRARSAFEFEHPIARADGSAGRARTRAVPVPDGDGGVAEWFGSTTEMVDSAPAGDSVREPWLHGQREALVAALDGSPLAVSLGALVRTAVEALDLGTRAAFYLTRDGGESLHHVVGMSPGYAEAIDGFPIGPESAACGLAAALNTPVISADVREDPRWEPWRALAERFDFRGCWSFPVRSTAGRVIGTFAVYWREPRAAADRDLKLAELLTDTAAIIIARAAESEARARAESALRAGEERNAFLLQFSDEARGLSDPAAVGLLACRLLAERIGVERAHWARIDWTSREYVTGWEFRTRGAPAEPIRWPLDPEQPFVADHLAGRTVIYDDAEVDPRIPPAARAAMAGRGLRSGIAVPVLVGGTLHAVLNISQPAPRLWRPEEAACVEAIAGRAWAEVERARAEEALRASEDSLRLAVAAGELGTWDWDLRTNRVSWNDSHFTMQGYGVGEVEPGYEAWLDRVHPDDRRAATAALNAARSSRSVYRADYRSLLPDGSVRWMSARGVFHHDGHDNPVRMIGVMRDVTDQREADDALRRSEDRLRQALEAARMGTWTWDVAADEHHRDANLNSLLGLPAVDTVRPFEDLVGHVHPDDRGLVRSAFDRSVQRGRPLNVEFRVVRPDGSVRWLRDQGDVFGTAGRARMTGACVDITDLKEIEGNLRDGEQEFRVVTDLVPELLWRLDLDAETGWVNRRWVEYTGLGNDEVHPWGWLEAVHPDDRANSRAAFERGMAAGLPFRFEHRLRRAADGAYRWFLVGAVPLCDDAGRIVHWFGAVTDVHDQRVWREELEARVEARTADLHAEVERRKDLTRRLATAQEDERQRVARDLHDSVGQLLVGLSLAIKKVELAGDLPVRAIAELAGVQAVLDGLGKELHGLAVRLRPTSLDDFGLGPAMEQLVAEWSSRAGVRADLHASGLEAGRLGSEIETTLYRVVQEALTNVAKHADARVVSVVVRRPNGHVIAVIEDDGRGFDPDATPAGRLGLMGIRERMALVGGEMVVESAPGAGTTVYVRIPIREGDGAGGPEDHPSAPA